jgi:hypothetical protein
MGVVATFIFGQITCDEKVGIIEWYSCYFFPLCQCYFFSCSMVKVLTGATKPQISSLAYYVLHVSSSSAVEINHYYYQ